MAAIIKQEIGNFWGFIDGSLDPCTVPTLEELQQTKYSGHKFRHAYQALYLFQSHGCIIWAKLADDHAHENFMYVTLKSKLYAKYGFEDSHNILGDSAFTRSARLIRAFADKELSTLPQRLHSNNQAHNGILK